MIVHSNAFVFSTSLLEVVFRYGVGPIDFNSQGSIFKYTFSEFNISNSTIF